MFGGLDVHVTVPIVQDAVERWIVYSRHTLLLWCFCWHTLLSRPPQGSLILVDLNLNELTLIDLILNELKLFFYCFSNLIITIILIELNLS